MDYKIVNNEINMINGNMNRMCVTDSKDELELMRKIAETRLFTIYDHNKSRLEEANNER